MLYEAVSFTKWNISIKIRKKFSNFSNLQDNEHFSKANNFCLNIYISHLTNIFNRKLKTPFIQDNSSTKSTVHVSGLDILRAFFKVVK